MMGDTVNRIGGAGHLPECQPDALLDPPLICICEELRAYADRVLGEAQGAIAALPKEDGGYCHVLHACDVEDVLYDLRGRQK